MKFESLRLYGRLLQFLRPHLGGLIGSIFFMSAFAAFSGITLAMIVPFTQIILSGKVPQATQVDEREVPGATQADERNIPEATQTDEREVPQTTQVDESPAPAARGSESAVSDVDARTASDGGARTALDGDARTASDGGARTASDVDARTASDGGARTASDVDAPSASKRVSRDSAAPKEEARSGLSLESIQERAKSAFYGWIQGRDTAQTVSRFCVFLFVVFLLKNLFWYAQSYLVVRVEQNVIRDIRNRLFAHYQTLSQDYFSASHSGALISRVTNDVDLVRGAIANGIADLIRQSLLLLVYLVTVLLASWKFFLVTIVILPPSLILIARIGQTLRRSSRVSQNKMARLTSVLSESLGGMRIIKAFGLETNRVERFSRETESYAQTMIRMTRIGSLASPLTEILGVAVACILLWYAGRQIAGDEEASARFLLFLVGMLAMMQPIKMLSQVNIKIQQGLAAARRIFEVLDSRPTVAEKPGARIVSTFRDEIHMDGVGFAYRSDVPVLEGIDLAIRKGEVVALVGPSGGGKSTLVDLIPRFYDPTVGRVTLDGTDLRDLRLADLRALIGLVTQETFLFEGTVAENVRMGRPDASDAEVAAAARAANAHEFIESWPERYDTWIGERGQLLSGGQRQRISIARAILKNPEILIFDEATSALDSESEALVQEAIDRLLENRTAVVIAHRLSTVRHADRIVVIAEGRIVESGRHEELIARQGLYRRLYEMQFQERDEPGRRRVAVPPEG